MTHTGPQDMLDTVYCGVHIYLLPVIGGGGGGGVLLQI